MNKQFLINAIVGALALTSAAAMTGCGPGDSQAANASAQAKPAKVGHEVCTDEVVTLTRKPKDKDQIAGTAAGAVIGGVLGNQVGHGDAKTLATAAGAVAGGYAGNKIQENAQEKNTYTETKRVCKTVYN
jgi:uncharacterized protein YcfJ